MRTCPVLAVASGLALFAALSGAAPVWAHHSFGATFDANKPVTITGVLTKVQWTNPHSHLHLDVKDKDGVSGGLGIRRLPVSRALPHGLVAGRNHEIGDTLTVVGWRARDDSPFALGREVTLPSGKHLFFGPLAGTVKALPSRRVTEPAKDSP